MTGNETIYKGFIYWIPFNSFIEYEFNLIKHGEHKINIIGFMNCICDEKCSENYEIYSFILKNTRNIYQR